MNLAWAKEWIGEFGAPEKIRRRYADRVDFEDVTFGHKETTGDGVKNFFASFSQDGGEHSFIVRNYSGGPEGGAWSPDIREESRSANRPSDSAA